MSHLLYPPNNAHLVTKAISDAVMADAFITIVFAMDKMTVATMKTSLQIQTSVHHVVTIGSGVQMEGVSLTGLFVMEDGIALMEVMSRPMEIQTCVRPVKLMSIDVIMDSVS